MALRAMALNRRQPDRALVMLRVRLASCSLQVPPQVAIALGPSVNTAVCGRPRGCKQNRSSAMACGQVLTCVRPQNAAPARRGPLWKSADRDHYAYARSKTLGGVLVCPIPSSDRLSIILR